jgi:alpha-L-fucosidase
MVRYIAGIVAVSMLFGSAAAQQPKGYLKAKPQDLKWWQDARFGMFIHWGPVSLQGTEIGWSRGGERRGTGGTGEVPLEVYDNLYKKFNPTKFDAAKWVRIAKAAGMKYMVFTTRHHDGFTEWDSKVTDYKITSPNSPYRKDIVKQLADACHKAGMRFGVYYSQPDWHNADYRTANHAKYVKYMHQQVRELLTNYGKIDVVWFDGLGGSAKDWDAENLFKMMRKLQPHILINNRCGLEGDFDTPEQTIGRFQNTRPWESCITICNQWAYKPNDSMKTLSECIRTLVTCAGGDGNLLFNVGPMPNGEIEPRQVTRLLEMGKWVKDNSFTIYGTRGGPFLPGPWGVSTSKGKSVFLHVFDPKLDELRLPPIDARILALAGGFPGGTADWSQTKDGIRIKLPARPENTVDFVIVLALDKEASKIKPVAAQSGSVATGKKASASNVFEKMAIYAPGKAVDDDPATRWATDAGTHQAWIQVDLGRPMTIASVVIDEEYGTRVRQFELQVAGPGGWKTIASGTRIGQGKKVSFAPVKAQLFRLNILDAEEGPTISEFKLFPPGKG